MRKFVVLFIVLFTVAVVSSCQNNRYFAHVNRLWNDYDMLFVQIVVPSLEIDDADEFLAYFASEEIVRKVEQAVSILEEIHTLIVEHNLEIARPSIQTMRRLTNLTTLKERLKTEEIEMRDRIVNGIRGYKDRLRNDVERKERNIEIYYEFWGDR